MPAELPMPPDDLLQRIGPIGPDGIAVYEHTGQQSREIIESTLPEEWSWTGKRVLDFGCGSGRIIRRFAPVADEGAFCGCDIDARSVEWLTENLDPPFSFSPCGEAPPLAYPTEHFDLIYAFSVYTHLTDNWAAWMLEHHRLLKPGGRMFVTFLGQGMMESLIGETWEEDRIGMNSLFHGHPWSLGGPISFNSPWWIRSHWGRAFEIEHLVEELPDDSWVRHGTVLLRKREVELSEEDLKAVDPQEPREYTALRHQAAQLASEVERLRVSERTARDELTRNDDAAGEAAARADHAEALLRAVTESRSWRLMAPFREVGTRLRSRARR